LPWEDGGDDGGPAVVEFQAVFADEFAEACAAQMVSGLSAIGAAL
jgi:hypothetical protein